MNEISDSWRDLPTGCLWEQLGLPLHGGNHEAALLFSSGSCAEPKGIVLSHRNIVGNCLQIRDLALLEGNHTLLGCLPVFHSFGFTVTGLHQRGLRGRHQAIFGIRMYKKP